jgi:ethanolamine transporter EutH
MTKRQRWLIIFLGTTLTAIAEELVSVLDGKGWTEPWTELIIKFIPRVVGAPAIVLFGLWLMTHFLSRYWHHPLLTPGKKFYTQTEVDGSNAAFFQSGWNSALKERNPK